MRKLLSVLLTFAIVAGLTLPMMGCEKAEKTVRTARVQSAKLAVYGEKITVAFGNAFVAGEISREQLADLNVVTGKFVKGLGMYREAVSAAERIVKSGQPLPRDHLSALDVLFNTEVVAAFTAISTKLGLLTIGQSDKIKTLMNGAQLVILAIKALIADARIQMQSAGVSYA